MAKRATASEKAMYQQMVDEFTFCWFCAWPILHQPYFGFLPCSLENAHIVGGPGRRHDRRALVRMCTYCHRISHGDTIKLKTEGEGSMMVIAPKIDQANMLAQKAIFDPDWFDVDYLNSISTRRLEDGVEPHEFYQQRLRKARVI